MEQPGSGCRPQLRGHGSLGEALYVRKRGLALALASRLGRDAWGNLLSWLAHRRPASTMATARSPTRTDRIRLRLSAAYLDARLPRKTAAFLRAVSHWALVANPLGSGGPALPPTARWLPRPRASSCRPGFRVVAGTPLSRQGWSDRGTRSHPRSTGRGPGAASRRCGAGRGSRSVPARPGQSGGGTERRTARSSRPPVGPQPARATR